MEAIPSHIIIGEKDLPSLENMYQLGLKDDDAALLRIDFTKFLKGAYATLEGLNKEVKKEDIEKSFFLRILMDKYATQAYRTRKIADYQEVSNDPWEKNILFHLSFNPPVKSNFSKPVIRLSKMPNDWKKLSNQKRTIYKIGGPGSDFSGWKGLNLQKVILRNLIIVDPYFLEDLDQAKFNLVEMLTGLLDTKASTQVSLMLVVRYDQEIKDHRMKKDLDSKGIQDVLKTKFHRTQFEISIAYVRKSFTHDRYLFTDFYYMSCQGGFNLYNRSEKIDNNRSMDLSIYFISDFEIARAYYKRLFEIHGWLKSSRSLFDSIGKLENRLFDIVC